MTSEKPKISVIIPTYNRSELLPRAINSVLNQTYKNFELIIIDDGSTDKTKEVVKKYLQKDSRIKYIYQENSGGPSRPKNTGIKKTTGDYIAFLDSDDEWFSCKLEKQINLYVKRDNDDDIGLIGCGAISVNSKNNKKRIIKPPYSIKIKSPKILQRTIPYSCSSIMIKKSVFKEIGLLDEELKMGEDYEIYVRISRKYKFLFIQEPLFNYYIHDNNISEPNNIINGKKINNRKKIIEKHKKIFSKYPNIYADEIKKIGTFNMLDKSYNLARKYFLKSIKINPFSRVYINFILSFNPKLYKKILLFKKYKKYEY